MRTKRSIDVRTEQGQGGADPISFAQKVETWLKVGPIPALPHTWCVAYLYKTDVAYG